MKRLACLLLLLVACVGAPAAIAQPTLPPVAVETAAPAPAVTPVEAPPAAAPAPAASPEASPPRGRAVRVAAPARPQTSEVIRLALVLSLMTLIPAFVICATPFVRIVVVLSMIRHGLGMPETPPNAVLISLALFLTAFTMMPTFGAINEQSLQPFLRGTIPVEQALERGSDPLRAFMLRQVSDKDIKAVYDMSRKPLPATAAAVEIMPLTAAFMLNELRVAFKIGFVILLPFLLIDLVVSSILLSLGMLMVPPSTLSLPIKVLMFVLIDGWSLVLQGVVGSFR